MIILEVEIPIMGKRYDFQIDEHVPLCEVKKEIAEMICRKNSAPFRGIRTDCLSGNRTAHSSGRNCPPRSADCAPEIRSCSYKRT